MSNNRELGKVYHSSSIGRTIISIVIKDHVSSLLPSFLQYRIPTISQVLF